MQRIFITGGSGYIGNHTIPNLKKSGYVVFNYDLKVNPKFDIFDHDSLIEKMRGYDVVYHLTAIPHPFEGDEAEYRMINYEGAINVFKCAVSANIKKFIFASSGCVYGFWGGNSKPDKLPLTEDNYIPTIAEGQTIYGYFKHEFEKYLQANSKQRNIKSISLRMEGVNPDIVKPPATGMFMPGKKPHQQSCKRWHLLGNCSIENYIQMLIKVIETDLESHYEVFNVENGHVHPDFDAQKIINEDFPDVPNNVKGNESLISIEKAKKILEYEPTIPEGFSISSKDIKMEKTDSQVSNKRNKGIVVILKKVIKRVLKILRLYP